MCLTLSVVVILLNVMGSPTLRYEEKFTTQLAFKPGNHLEVSTSNGNIEVTTWDKDSLAVEATKFVETPTETEATELIREIKIDIKQLNTGICISTQLPRTNYNIGVNYKLTLPKQANLNLRSYNGNIVIHNVDGITTAKTYNGEVKVYDLKNKVDIDTHNGSITAHNIEGDAKLTTHNGKLNLTGTFTNLHAETDNGSISCDITRWQASADITLETHNGNITAHLPHVTGIAIYAESHNGKVTSDFPIYTKPEQLKGNNVMVKLITHNGNVKVIKSK